MKGKVYLVGAGPGDPELLTVKALRLLREAHVVLHDDLVSPEILAQVRPTAAVKNVGKRCGKKRLLQQEIHALMITHAAAGQVVVRLKGGDPLIFGRAGEEMEALHRAGIPFEVVPGVTAALAAAAAVRISLTDRRRAGRLLFLSGSRSAGSLHSDQDGRLPADATIVVYMPGKSYSRISAELTRAGLDPQASCVIVSAAGSQSERIGRTTLGKLAETPLFPAPALMIVGEVAAQATLAREGIERLEEMSHQEATPAGAVIADFTAPDGNTGKEFQSLLPATAHRNSR